MASEAFEPALPAAALERTAATAADSAAARARSLMMGHHYSGIPLGPRLIRRQSSGRQVLVGPIRALSPTWRLRTSLVLETTGGSMPRRSSKQF